MDSERAGTRSSDSASSIICQSHSCVILLGKRHVLAIGIAPRATSGFRVKHQGEQTQRFRFLRQQLGHQPRQKQGFLGEVAADDIGPARIGPTFREGGVDGVQHRVEPAGKLLALRDARTECRPAGSSPWPARAACAMAAGEMRNADAIVFASKPTTTCSISGARTPASMAGCAQANIRARRWSGMSASAAAASNPSARICNCRAAASPLECRRATSISFRRATVAATPPDSTGSHSAANRPAPRRTRRTGRLQRPATSRVRAARKATSFP